MPSSLAPHAELDGLFDSIWKHYSERGQTQLIKRRLQRLYELRVLCPGLRVDPEKAAEAAERMESLITVHKEQVNNEFFAKDASKEAEKEKADSRKERIWCLIAAAVFVPSLAVSPFFPALLHHLANINIGETANVLWYGIVGAEGLLVAERGISSVTDYVQSNRLTNKSVRLGLASAAARDQINGEFSKIATGAELAAAEFWRHRYHNRRFQTPADEPVRMARLETISDSTEYRHETFEVVNGILEDCGQLCGERIPFIPPRPRTTIELTDSASEMGLVIKERERWEQFAEGLALSFQSWGIRTRHIDTIGDSYPPAIASHWTDAAMIRLIDHDITAIERDIRSELDTDDLDEPQIAFVLPRPADVTRLFLERDDTHELRGETGLPGYGTLEQREVFPWDDPYEEGMGIELEVIPDEM